VACETAFGSVTQGLGLEAHVLEVPERFRDVSVRACHPRLEDEQRLDAEELCKDGPTGCRPQECLQVGARNGASVDENGHRDQQ